MYPTEGTPSVKVYLTVRGTPRRQVAMMWPGQSEQRGWWGEESERLWVGEGKQISKALWVMGRTLNFILSEMQTARRFCADE